MTFKYLTFVACLASVIFLCHQELAQAQQQNNSRAMTEGSARKFDEYGRLYGCDSGARLDNFAIELQNNPEAQGYIVGYDPLKTAPGTAEVWLERMRDYLTNARGLDESRVVIIAGGRHTGESLKVELWVAPKGAAAPVPVPIEEELSDPKFSGKFDEYFTSDGSYYDDGGVDGSAFSTGMVQQAFAKRLRQQPESHGYIVVYDSPDSKPGTWRRIATRERQEIGEDSIDPSRLSIINGGEFKPSEDDSELSKVELWMLPKDEPPPVKSRAAEKALTEATKLNTLESFIDDENDPSAKWMFTNLADMLRDDKERVGCIIVHPPDTSEKDESIAETEVTVADEKEAGEVKISEKPPFDVFKLAERWKSELIKDHNVAAHRIIVMVGPSSSWSRGDLETWVVPPDASLPDPFADDEAEMNNEEPPVDQSDEPPAIEPFR